MGKNIKDKYLDNLNQRIEKAENPTILERLLKLKENFLKIFG